MVYIFKTFYINGNLHISGQLNKDHRKVGQWTYYRKDGTRYARVNYSSNTSLYILAMYLIISICRRTRLINFLCKMWPKSETFIKDVRRQANKISIDIEKGTKEAIDSFTHFLQTLVVNMKTCHQDVCDITPIDNYTTHATEPHTICEDNDSGHETPEEVVDLNDRIQNILVERIFNAFAPKDIVHTCTHPLEDSYHSSTDNSTEMYDPLPEVQDSCEIDPLVQSDSCYNSLTTLQQSENVQQNVETIQQEIDNLEQNINEYLQDSIQETIESSEECIDEASWICEKCKTDHLPTDPCIEDWLDAVHSIPNAPQWIEMEDYGQESDTASENSEGYIEF